MQLNPELEFKFCWAAAAIEASVDLVDQKRTQIDVQAAPQQPGHGM
jgi:hypothetical protein